MLYTVLYTVTSEITVEANDAEAAYAAASEELAVGETGVQVDSELAVLGRER